MKEFTINDINREDEESMQFLRALRSQNCFGVINRGQLWYDKLTPEQYTELGLWYNTWLNVTDTNPIIVPIKPEWLI